MHHIYLFNPFIVEMTALRADSGNGMSLMKSGKRRNKSRIFKL